MDRAVRAKSFQLIALQRRYLSKSTVHNQEHGNGTQKAVKPKQTAKEKLAAREFFLSVLSTTATKRDAKQYLSEYQPLKTDQGGDKKKAQSKTSSVRAQSTAVSNAEKVPTSGVNLGQLYAYPRAHEQSPIFSRQLPPDKHVVKDLRTLHLAIVKLQNPQNLSEDILDGVGLTLTQLNRLGLHSIVVVDCGGDDQADANLTASRMQTKQQAERVAQIVRKHNEKGARVVEQALSWREVNKDTPSIVRIKSRVNVALKTLLRKPLAAGTIPIVPPIAYTENGCQARFVKANDVILAITRAFSAISSASGPDSSGDVDKEAARPTAVDRIIVLDPIGGLPKNPMTKDAHIFVNMEQEYSGIRGELQRASGGTTIVREDLESQPSVLGLSNPFSKFVESELQPELGEDETQDFVQEQAAVQAQHVRNLDLIQQALAILPPSSSALVTTPAEAAGSATITKTQVSMGVGTRPKRNPLIHNLLTDRPVISSSLPSARLNADRMHQQAASQTATFFKRGMPLTMVPEPVTASSIGWTCPTVNEPRLRLEKDPRIDFPRLVYLIENSFGRPLNVRHYLSRVENILAGVIIAGAYEGGAILTWEKPPSYPTHAPVPYLDKFAVLRKAQGSGGVADIVFNAMVRTCFPNGVVWRSRSNNPVNKWYFERATGTFKIPGSQWCMFWTGDIGGLTGERWEDYVDVCRSIEASWADNSKPPD